MSEITTSEILISDLPTKQVTLAPQQVTIVREIPTTIQPGQNEITLLGLDPRVNAHSIRIEGSGAATITDIQTSIVARDEDFNDVYPPDDSDSDSDADSNAEEEEDISEDEDGLNDNELQEIRREMARVEAKIATARSEINSALSMLGIMDQYGKGFSTEKNRDVKKFGEFLELYNGRRKEEAERHQKAHAEIAVRERELAKLQRKFSRRKVRYAKERREASKALRLRKEKRDRALARKKALQSQKRNELRAFWTSTVGKVVVSLDSQSLGFTPGSSRRSSIVSAVIARSDESQKQDLIDVTLRLSYIVPGRSWFPRYELRINSPSSSARLTYRAEFNNLTTEIWRDTRVTLSTSQASFDGIGVRIPYLDPWNIKRVTTLSKSPAWHRILENPHGLLGPTPPPFPKNGLFGAPPPQVPGAQKGFLSGQPKPVFAFNNVDAGNAAPGNGFGQSAPAANSASLFGGNAQANNAGGGLFGAPAPAPAAAPSLFGAAPNNPGGGFGSNNAAGGFGNMVPRPAARSKKVVIDALQNEEVQSIGDGLFGSVPSSAHSRPRPRLAASISADDGDSQAETLPPPPAPGAAAPASILPTPTDEQLPSPQPGGGRGLFARLTQSITGDESEPSKEISATVELENSDSDSDGADAQTLTSTSLEHQDSVKQDYGMTTTYELPGRRTLSPSHVARRHVLAELDLKSVALTYVIVPKRREAAFLRARIKNTSSLTLHPGQVGITVDGSFVGTAGLDTCAPGVFFNISLGIDPGIEVKYSKPSVKPLAGALFFNKEDGAKFRRSTWVKNTKGVAVDLLVSDQIPISDDEKLRVRVLEPVGLEKEGDEVDVKMEKSKGSGTAALRKNGEVKWTLKLQPSQEIRLVLEYEAKVPVGSDVSPV
ncbi:hypothetical protein BJX68DRAFT_223471 [Aspergillus pseudodeflectus]|uniref:DUF4139 domain-containing protein n=1 Tax=Aspergillus pseudodeflectus TaxID=176178 RepID=A0ABR4LBL1_9EURO